MNLGVGQVKLREQEAEAAAASGHRPHGH